MFVVLLVINSDFSPLGNPPRLKKYSPGFKIMVIARPIIIATEVVKIKYNKSFKPKALRFSDVLLTIPVIIDANIKGIIII